MKLIDVSSASLLKMAALGSGGALLGLPFGAAVTAQTPPSTVVEGLDEIVVTAQKRDERISDAPLAVAAIGGEDIARQRILSATDLSGLAPGVFVGSQNGMARINIRGVGLAIQSNGADSSSTFNIDGVVVSRPSAQLGAFFDLERVEVLRGPQGTLYGRNATGGSVNIITRQPSDQMGGYLNAGYGNFNQIELSGAVTGPVSSDGHLSARLAAQYVKRDGFGRNRFLNQDINNEDRISMRGSIAFKRDERFAAVLTLDYSREDDGNHAAVSFGPLPGFTLAGVAFGFQTLKDPYDIVSNVPALNRRSNFGATASLSFEASDLVTLTSITGYRDFRRRNVLDSDLTTMPLAEIGYIEESQQFSEELQGQYQSDKLNGIMGLYYFHEKLFGVVAVPNFGNLLGVPGLQIDYRGNTKTDAYALFTQWTYSLADKVRATAGLRYSYEKRTNVGTFTNLSAPIAFSEGASFSSLTPKFGIDYKPSTDSLIYASITRGFKSGAFVNGSIDPAVRPETVWAYEIGAKATLDERRLRFGASFYWNDYQDLQLLQIVGFRAVLRNAAEARIRGAELTAEFAPVTGLRLDLNAAYTDARYRNFQSVNEVTGALDDLSGNRLQNAPKWSLSGGITYEASVGPGKATANLNFGHRSRVFFDEFNRVPLSQKSNTKLNASLDYVLDDTGFTIGIWGRNLTNQAIASNAILNSGFIGFPIYGYYEPPRTYGVRAGYAF
jgi:iron complex outermembrane recepter protein